VLRLYEHLPSTTIARLKHLLLATVVFTCIAADALPPIPDREGFAGSFAGVSGGALIVAGGANFPDKKPWHGGTKVWYDSVFVLDQADGKWAAAGKLPRPLGYGVCASWRDGVVCVGGSDATRHYAECFVLKWSAGKLTVDKLPSLPKPLANTCGALAGDLLYVVGGIESPAANETFAGGYCIDLAERDPQWTTMRQCPGGGRMLATSAVFNGHLFIAGGVSLSAGPDGKPVRNYLKDAWRYSPKGGWTKIADLPRPAVAAPSPAPVDASAFYILGGDDGTQVADDPEKHRGFPRSILRFDVKSGTWSEAGELPFACVTVPCVRWADAWIIPGGEVRPGIRSPQVWRWNPEQK
jgi:N-acetylneuraminic acid mutarotase